MESTFDHKSSQVRDPQRRSMALRIYALLTPRERLRLAGFFVMMLLGAVLELLGVSLILPFMKLVAEPSIATEHERLRQAYQWLGFSSHRHFLGAVSVVLLVVYLAKNAYFWLFYHLQFHFFSQKKIAGSRALMSFYMQAPYSFHLQKNPAEVIRNLQSAARLVDAVLGPFMIIGTEAVVLAVILCYLFVVQPLVTATAIVVIGGTALALYLVIRTKLSHYSKEAFICSAEQLKTLYNAFLGLKETKVLGREKYFIDAYIKYFERDAIAAARVGILNQLPRLFMESILVTVVMAFVLSVLVTGQDPQTLIPVLALFAVAAFRLMPSMNRIISAAISMRQGTNFVSYADDGHHDLRGSASASMATLDAASRQKSLAFVEKIDLQNITYSYADSKQASVRGVSLSIKRGQAIAFVGHSGAGKTTLADIILGLLSPTGGKILVDGVDVTRDIAAWQEKIGYIPQQIYLSDDSIRRNVAFGVADEEIDEQQVWAALRAAYLEDFVRSLEHGLDTTVGDRGVRLSGGQRQRIGIARCLYHNREVLVLDEATSALDNETEQAIVQSIARLSGERTIIIIAHRLTTVARCDRLFFMSAGAIVASGTYDELCKDNQDFARFANV